MFLKVSQVDVRYAGQSRSAVQGVSLKLQAGQIGVLIGPSGCGKTSLLRAIAGLEDLNAGQVELSNRVVSRQEFTEAPEKRRMGMVFQDYALFPHLTVAENIAFGLQNLQKSSQTQRIQEVLDLVGLTEVKSRYPHELSGGQQQRVDLARALAPKPELLLLDEPFSKLDAALRGQLRPWVFAHVRQRRIPVVLVTHDRQDIADPLRVVELAPC
jgi:iron(III) transport system ATP-binding protein